MKKLLLLFVLFTSTFAATAQTNDVGVIDFISPTRNQGNPTNPIPITVRVANYGTTPQTNVSIVLEMITPVGFQTMVNTFTGPFFPDSLVTLTLGFWPPVQGTIGCGSLLAYTVLPNDVKLTNDTAYFCPNMDVGVDSILNPLPRGTYSNQEVVQVRLQNYGSATATHFPVSYKLNGQPAVTETYRGLLQAGDSAIYSFNTNLDASQDTSMCNRRFKAYSALPNDSDRMNDTAYTCSVNDLAVDSIAAPDFNLPVIQTVQVYIKNHGTVARTVGQIDFIGRDQNQNVIISMQAIDPTMLGPGDSTLFSAPVNFPTAPLACIEVIISQDDILPNNTGTTCRQTVAGTIKIKDKSISVYPNPASDNFILYGDEPATVTLHNLAGKHVKVWKKTEKIFNANISDLASGTYILKLIMKNEIKVQKLVVK